MAHLRINPGLRILRRDSGSLQLGTGPGGVLLDGTDEADLAFIGQLRRGLDRGGLRMAAAECRISTVRAEALLAALEPVLVDEAGQDLGTDGLRADRLAPDRDRWSAVYGCDGTSLVARRSSAAVHLIGLGRTGAAVACALAAAGVGTLLVEDPRPVGAADIGAGAYRLADIGLNRAQALRRNVHQIDPTIGCYPIGGTSGRSEHAVPRMLSLAVYTAAEVADSTVGAVLMSRGHPHLGVLCREQDALVGPLVVPGESACLECLNRHRADTDPGWYTLSTELAALQATAPPADEASLAVAAAGLAALQALLYLDGRNRPAAWSAVLQLRPADGTVLRHEYPPHPDCGCVLPPERATGG
ncbi:TOMM precursor leader peptide-binding protein [Arthrobacter sp. I2-34]|uniref:TOMM leader peptide-binding protein n=1 Tax=Arthrobacter hankyongi TaxID=2904801 RepID=A0ABS9L8C4_9MICC|nr:TOMM precursor leader peptide-binding protein [Arthrobacter hankyongi]MCG2622773.1 TOMM precursor leader peptide-binding protein [Arthrobacter hankyongi]